MATTTTQDVDGRTTQREALAPVALALAGLLFIAYPVLRPYADETTLDGAAAMASTAWLVSHLLGAAAFVLLAAGLPRSGPRTAAWLAAALVLPYYGAETFGLHAVGARAVADGDASLLALAEELRMAPVAVTVFGLGLLALAVAGVLLVRRWWPHGGSARLGALLAGGGLVLYLPQFFAPPAVRIGHGVVLGVGLMLLAVSRLRQGDD